MADLISANTMATWCQVPIAELAADPFATDIRKKVSDYVRLLAGHPDWTEATVPVDVQIIVIWVCKRTYNNPDQEVASGVGPISSRVLDEAALAMSLTESERATLAGYNEALTESTTGFWTFGVGGLGPILEPTVYLPDDSLSDWEIPMFDPYDLNSPIAPGNLP